MWQVMHLLGTLSENTGNTSIMGKLLFEHCCVSSAFTAYRTAAHLSHEQVFQTVNLGLDKCISKGRNAFWLMLKVCINANIRGLTLWSVSMVFCKCSVKYFINIHSTSWLAICQEVSKEPIQATCVRLKLNLAVTMDQFEIKKVVGNIPDILFQATGFV